MTEKKKKLEGCGTIPPHEITSFDKIVEKILHVPRDEKCRDAWFALIPDRYKDD